MTIKKIKEYLTESMGYIDEDLEELNKEGLLNLVDNVEEAKEFTK